MPPPPSQHGAADSQAGPHAGSQAGAHTGAGAAHGAGVEPHDRNSMNDGRRQLLPMQLLHPGAAARLATAITRHNARVMSKVSHSTQTGQAGGSHACGVAHDATQTVPHDCGAAGRQRDFFGGLPRSWCGRGTAADREGCAAAIRKYRLRKMVRLPVLELHRDVRRQLIVRAPSEPLAHKPTPDHPNCDATSITPALCRLLFVPVPDRGCTGRLAGRGRRPRLRGRRRVDGEHAAAARHLRDSRAGRLRGRAATGRPLGARRPYRTARRARAAAGVFHPRQPL